MGSVLSITSCADEGKENEGYVTYYPTFEYEPVVVVDLGNSFSPEVKATEDGKELKVESSGIEDVDINTVGAYTITYSAVNSDGYEGEVEQTVVVHDPNIVGTDVSGEIVDANNSTRTATISLVPGTKSIFYCTDFAFGGKFPMYFQMNGDVISEVKQVYIFGVSNVNLTYNPATKLFTTKVNPQGFSYTFKYK